MAEERKTHLRIDFVVQEVADDGGPTDDLRYIKFGDDVPIPHARDFFDRCGNAMGLIFRQAGGYVSLIEPGPNKIAAIKVVRELGQYGLKEAKDIIEAPTGTAIVACEDIYSQEDAVRKLAETGCKVEIRSARSSDANRGILPAVATYRRHR